MLDQPPEVGREDEAEPTPDADGLEQVTVRMTRDMLDQLRKLADDEDRTVAQQIRHIVRKALTPAAPITFPKPNTITTINQPAGCNAWNHPREPHLCSDYDCEAAR